MSQETKGSQGSNNRQGGNNRNRNRNRNRNQNNRSGENRGGGNKQNGGNRQRSGGSHQRAAKPLPLTFWEKVLKFFGLYKAPTRPPRRASTGAHPAHEKQANQDSKATSPKSNTRNARSKNDGAKKEVSNNKAKAANPTKNFPVETPRLYLGNLSYDATEHDIEELFKGVGTVRNVEIIYNRHTHRSKGYGFLEMLNVEEAKRAVEILHEQPFMGRNLVVNGANAKPQQSEGSRNSGSNNNRAPKERAPKENAQVKEEAPAAEEKPAE